MRVLITGAYGFLGSHIAAHLYACGHEIVAAGRDVAYGRKRYPHFTWIKCDFNRDISPADWLPRLQHVDTVINCVGILQGSLRDNADAVHRVSPAALFKACEEAGIKRVIQMSALGAGEPTGTAYAATKAAGDEILAATNLDWVILRPSLVYCRGVFGGSAMLRGLAGFPIVTPRIAGDHFVQPVHMNDLVKIVAHLIGPGAPKRLILNVVGPEEITLADFVHVTRAWLGFRRQAELVIPKWLAAFAARFGDVAGWFGSRTPLRTTPMKQMEVHNTAPMAPLVEATGLTPRTMKEAFAAEPAEVQDRWHARLYFMKPIARTVLALFWIISGLVLLNPISFSYAAGILMQVGFSPALAAAATTFAALADVTLGVLLLIRWRVTWVITAQLAMAAFYLVMLTVTLPALWLDALGSLLKVIPIIAFSIFVLAIEDER